MNPYILPSISTVPPNKLTVTQFIQTVFVGISGLPGSMVRPKWQPQPPKQPDLEVSWMALGISNAVPDANSYIGTKVDETVESQRHETLEISCAIYGPYCLEIYELLRDGFQIQQNRIELQNANMGFVQITNGRKIPDLVNERWIERIETSVFLRREIQRIYPIPTIISSDGTIYTVIGNEDYLKVWKVPSN